MLNTFIYPLPFTPISKSPVWVNLKPKFIRDIDIINEYYRNSNRVVKNNHILVRLIKLLEIDTTLSEGVYYSELFKLLPYRINNLGLTTLTKYGDELFSPISPNTIGSIIVTDEPFNIFSIHKEWKDISALEVVSHNTCDISMNHPADSETINTIYYKLNVRLLMFQYKYWLADRIKSGHSTNIANFIYAYVLTNSISSYLDASIINITLSNDPIIFDPTHNFAIGNYTRDCIKLRIYNIKKFRDARKPYSFETMLANIECITKENALQFMQLSMPNSKTTTIQFYYLATINISMLILNTYKHGLGRDNQHTLDIYQKMLKLDIRRGVFNNISEEYVNSLIEISKGL